MRTPAARVAARSCFSCQHGILTSSDDICFASLFSERATHMPAMSARDAYRILSSSAPRADIERHSHHVSASG